MEEIESTLSSHGHRSKQQRCSYVENPCFVQSIEPACGAVATRSKMVIMSQGLQNMLLRRSYCRVDFESVDQIAA